MSATHLGIITQYAPGSQTEIGFNGGAPHTRTIKRTMEKRLAHDIANHPTGGVIDCGLVFTLAKITIVDNEGDMSDVTYTYGVPVLTSDPNASATESGLYGGRVGSAVTEFYESDRTLETVSILRHKRYRTLASADLRILAEMIQLGPVDENGIARRTGLTGTDRAEECADKIEAGTVSYLAAKHIWRKRITGGKWNTNPRKLGKIDTPPGPVPDIDGNWLYMGSNISGWDGGTFETVHTWESSPEGDTWDADLYGGKN